MLPFRLIERPLNRSGALGSGGGLAQAGFASLDYVAAGLVGKQVRDVERRLLIEP
jgi:hypothetical protein